MIQHDWSFINETREICHFVFTFTCLCANNGDQWLLYYTVVSNIRSRMFPDPTFTMLTELSSVALILSWYYAPIIGFPLGGGTPGWGGDFVKNHVENCQFLPPIWGQHCWKLLISPSYMGADNNLWRYFIPALWLWSNLVLQNKDIEYRCLDWLPKKSLELKE